jgi:glycosyltransferase involved in cell wall biosynthesis
VRLLTCICTFNRLDYTQRCIESWLDTRNPKWDHLVVVDNASTDGTQAYLDSLPFTDVFAVLKNDRNLFPGAATNLGWFHGCATVLQQDLGEPRLLHRSDNDVEYLAGWSDRVRDAFSQIENLGQLGILNAHEDEQAGTMNRSNWPKDPTGTIYLVPTGGNCVIPKSLWDEGLRWEAGAWRPGGRDEDTLMSQAIMSRGLLVGRLVDTCANNMSFGRYADHPEYYNQSAALRGLVAETSV